jgi:hypothetical protein
MPASHSTPFRNNESPLAVVTALGTKTNFNILHIGNYVLFANLWMNDRKVAKR